MTGDDMRRAYEEEIGKLSARLDFDNERHRINPEHPRTIVLFFVVLFSIGLAGGWLAYLPPTWARIPTLSSRILDSNRYLGVLLMAPFFVNGTIYPLLLVYDKQFAYKDFPRLPPLFVGSIESLMFPLSYTFYPAFIPVWLTLKAISRWAPWSGGQQGRMIFNRYLFGTGLSLLLNAVVLGCLIVLDGARL